MLVRVQYHPLREARGPRSPLPCEQRPACLAPGASCADETWSRQARDLVRTKLAKLVGGQSLLDYSNVFVLPDVDDLDNYMQGVLDDVSKTEIPDPDEISAKSVGTQSLSADVLPSPGSIGNFLKTVIDAALALGKESDEGKAKKLRSKGVRLVEVARDLPQSRDLIAMRLRQLRPKTQSLLDYSNVFVTPTVDDLDSYLQVSLPFPPSPSPLPLPPHPIRL